MASSKILVSVLMPTYNRFPKHGHLVEEALESFLRQTYPNKELLIGNDTPGQEIVFNHPQVRVFNFPTRFDFLSDKLRLMIGQARGDVMCWFDDDDISLPHRLEYSVEHLGDRLEWHAENYVYSDAEKLVEVVPGNGHALCIWRRELLTKIGGFPSRISNGYDLAFNAAMVHAGVGNVGELIHSKDMYYIYRWGNGSVHLSGRNIRSGESNSDTHYNEITKHPITPGRYELHPHWRRDYVADVLAMHGEQLAKHAP